MRFFEVLLVLAGTVFLFDFIFIKSTRKIMLYLYLGVTSLLTVLHLVLEKGRWPMSPAYIILFFLFLVCIKRLLLPGNEPKRFRLPGKVILSILTLVFVSFSIISPALLLPVFTIKDKPADEVIGSVSRCLTDTSRIDSPFSNENRELMVQIWYPAEKDKTSEKMSYYPYPGMSGAFAKMTGYPEFFFSNLDLVKTNTYADAKPSDKQKQYPVLIFSHGFRQTRFDYAFQTEEWVRRGYIVVGIDHTHYTSSTVFPDEHSTKVDVDRTKMEEDRAEIENAEKIWIQDAEFVIDSLENMNTDDPVFAGKFDLQRLGYAGHSIGGATALHTLLQDDRIKAAVNMDGFIPGYQNEPFSKPILIFTHDERMNKASPGSLAERLYKEQADSINSAYNNAKCAAYLVNIDKTVHMSFSDTSILTRAFAPGLTPPEQCFKIINEYTIGFFDKYLNHQDSGILNKVTPDYPEVTVKYNDK